MGHTHRHLAYHKVFKVAPAKQDIANIYINLHYFEDLAKGIKARVQFKGVDGRTQHCNMLQPFSIHVWEDHGRFDIFGEHLL